MPPPVTFYVNTTADYFANWIEKRTAMAPYEEFRSAAGQFCLQPVRRATTQTGRPFTLVAEAMLITPSPTEPNTLVGSQPFAGIEFDPTAVALERIEVRAQCHYDVFTTYFHALLAAIAEAWPNASDDIRRYLRARTFKFADGLWTSEIPAAAVAECAFPLPIPASAFRNWLNAYGQRMPARLYGDDRFTLLWHPDAVEEQTLESGEGFRLTFVAHRITWVEEKQHELAKPVVHTEELNPAIDFAVLPLGGESCHVVARCHNVAVNGDFWSVLEAIAETWPTSREAIARHLRALGSEELQGEGAPEPAATGATQRTGLPVPKRRDGQDVARRSYRLPDFERHRAIWDAIALVWDRTKNYGQCRQYLMSKYASLLRKGNRGPTIDNKTLRRIIEEGREGLLVKPLSDPRDKLR